MRAHVASFAVWLLVPPLLLAALPLSHPFIRRVAVETVLHPNVRRDVGYVGLAEWWYRTTFGG